MFYSNRAACKSSQTYATLVVGSSSEIGYINLLPPKLDLVVQDCDEALKLNPDYVKALNRRATALEQLGQYESALRGMLALHHSYGNIPGWLFSILDFTAATILDRFQNSSSATAVERILKVMASEKAKELIAVCAPPLHHSI